MEATNRGKDWKGKKKATEKTIVAEETVILTLNWAAVIKEANEWNT